MDKFDPYEFIAVILPGSVVLFGVLYLFPSAKPVFGTDMNVGGLGLFVIASFIVGHLIQGFGNALGWAWWKWKGMPTDWVRQPVQDLIGDEQRRRLADILLREKNCTLDRLDRKQWYSMVREICSTITHAGRSKRIDAFNRNYGLLRGLTVGCLIFAGLAAYAQPENWLLWTIAFFMAGVSAYRMHRFAVIYGREVFTEYLSIKSEPPK